MNFYKPFLKKTLYLNEILTKNYKLLKFKHKKWFQAIMMFKRQLIKNKLTKFKLIDQKKILLNFNINKANSYKLHYKSYFTCLKRLKCYYSNIFNKMLRKNITLYIVLNLLERRIDVSLLKLKFCLTLREAKKLIIDGYISINKNRATVKSYILSCGDILRLTVSLEKYAKLLIKCFKWNIPRINKMINYTTKEVLIFSLPRLFGLVLNFPYYLYLNRIYIITDKNGEFRNIL